MDFLAALGFILAFGMIFALVIVETWAAVLRLYATIKMRRQVNHQVKADRLT